MLPRSILLSAALAALVATAHAEMSVERLAPGVYALLQPHDERFDDSNSLVVVGAREVLVVDAQAHPERVRAVIASIRGLSDAPVTTVINTHWHGDHIQGNAVYQQQFGPEVTFLGHETLVADVPQRAATALRERLERYRAAIPDAEAALALGRDRAGAPLDAEGRRQQRAAIDRAQRWVERNRDARFVAPTRTYTCESDLQVDDKTVQLRHCNAHTRGDTVVWLPNERIVATGDVLDDLPYVGHGDPRGWLDCLDAIAALDAELYVPGHGPVLRGPQKLHAVRAYLSSLLQHAQSARAAGLPLAAAVASFDGSAHRDALAGDDAAAQRFFDATLEEALARAWEVTAPD